MSISTIIFDLGGVLVWTDWVRFTQKITESTGLSHDEVMQALVQGDAYHPFMMGEFDRTEFCARLTNQFQIDLGQQAVIDLWNQVIQPHHEIAATIERLSGKYRLVTGSNTDELHYGAGLEVQPAMRFFDDAILSYEVEVLKPDMNFFVLGLDRVSANAEECVFFDDRQDNVDAAISAGITAFQFTGLDKLRSDLLSLGIDAG